MCGAVRYYNISKIKNTEKSEGYKNENRKFDFERCGGAGSDGGRDRSAVPRALLLVRRSVLRDGNGLDESAAVEL